MLKTLKTLWVDELDPAQLKAVRNLLLAARDADGWPAVTATGPLPGEFTGGPHLLGYAEDGAGDLVGYGHLDETGDAFGRQVAELIVHPAHRKRGYGARLFGALATRAGPALRVWSHSDHPSAAALAASSGFERVRELLIMSADTAALKLDSVAMPPGVRLRTFEPGADEAAMIAVNARAFSWHPEQGALTADDLLAAEGEDWFEPAGFFVAEDQDGRLLGFHWTKVHPPVNEGAGEAVGEVYVVGVDPGAQGGGLGKALTVAGLRHLRAKGLPRVILYVEGDNAPAIAVYTRLGFSTVSTAVQYERVIG